MQYYLHQGWLRNGLYMKFSPLEIQFICNLVPKFVFEKIKKQQLYKTWKIDCLNLVADPRQNLVDDQDQVKDQNRAFIFFYSVYFICLEPPFQTEQPVLTVFLKLYLLKNENSANKGHWAVSSISRRNLINQCTFVLFLILTKYMSIDYHFYMVKKLICQSLNL